jgi:parallel beta-helix repeat protein
VVILVVFSGAVNGRVITVDDDGVADFNTIQAAVEDANDGDSILVEAGTYGECLYISKDINLEAALPGEAEIVCAEANDWLVTCDGCSFGIYGFLINASEPNQGGVKVVSGNATIKNNTITESVKGVYLTGSAGLIEGNRIMGNHEGVYGEGCQVTIKNNVIANNEGDGIHLYDSNSTISNNTIFANAGGGIACYAGPGFEHVIYNNIIVQNDVGIFGLSETSIPAPGFMDIAYNNLYGNEADYLSKFSGVSGPIGGAYYTTQPFAPAPVIGEIGVDPLFYDSNSGDFHLKSIQWRWSDANSVWTWDLVTSRCMDAGNPGCETSSEPLDHLKNRINMGAYGGTDKASVPPYLWAILSDINNDGIVNLSDFNCQQSWYEIDGMANAGDLDGDSVVDSNDLGQLCEQWLDKTAWY